MNRKDKRSRKTVSAIQNTLLQLLCSRRVREIKIVDLCTAADINRTTFYLHYAGITDVLDELRDEITERVFAATDPTTDFLDPQDPLPFLTTATGVFETYPHFADFIRHSQDADVFLTKLKNEFTAKLCRRYLQSCENGEENAECAECVFRFLTAGVLDTYTEWLKSDRSVAFSTILAKCAPIVAAGQEILAKRS